MVDFEQINVTWENQFIFTLLLGSYNMQLSIMYVTYWYGLCKLIPILEILPHGFKKMT